MLNNEGGRKRHPPPNSPYKGTAYRSIAFGTWAVGDASRHFEDRKRGRSSGAGEMRRRLQNGGNAEMMMGESSHSKKVQIDKSVRPSLESPSKLMMSHSMSDIRHQQLGTTLPIMNMNANAKNADLYSSNEYVQHNNNVIPPAASLPQSPLALCSISSPSSSNSNHRSLETLHFLNHHNNPTNNHPSCSSPVPSRISCPPTRRHRFAFIVDPLKANGPMNIKHQQNCGGMRNRTKSLDNGLKFSLDGRQRQNKEEERKGEMAKDGKNANEIGHSRLDQAKQFFRRFYASSMANRKKRKEETQMMANGDGALMYSSAIGPFFEFRRPCAEELPLLPYNIHFAVDSPPQCSSADDSEEDEDEELDEGGIKGLTTIGRIKHQNEEMANSHHQLAGEANNNNISSPFSFSSSLSSSSTLSNVLALERRNTLPSSRNVNEMTGTHIEYLFEFFYAMSDEDLRTELAHENLDTSGNRAQLLGRLRRHYRTALVEIRKRRKGSSKTENFYNYFIVIDFECSCEENNYDFEHEIIEFPACLVNVHSRKIVDQFRTIVRPVKRPKLTEFCQKLTGITQEMVDQAPTFPEALKKFRVWMAKHGLDGIGRSTGGNAKRFCYVTDGPWDIGKFLQMQCIHSGIKVPHDLRLFLNIRRSFVNFYFHPQGHREAAQKKLPNVDLNSMLGHLGMKFEGHQHCGLDDTTNIARIVIRMLQDKAELRVNEKLVLGTKLRRWQKLIFTENAKAPSCHVTPSTSAEEYSAQIEGENVDEFVQNFGQKLSINPNLDENMAKIHRENEEEGGKMIVWKKWWDLMPYKLVKIGRVDFLGERHLECESCDDFGGSDEEEEDEYGEEKKK